MRAYERARARRRLHGQRRRAAGGLAVGDRAGLRRDQHEPLDYQAEIRRPAPRAGGQRILPPHDARRIRAQHACRELSLAVFERHLGRQPRTEGSLRLLLQPQPSRRVFRAWRRRRGGVAGRRPARLHGKQLRHAAHGRDRCARAVEPPRADAVPAQERALSLRDERGRRSVTSDLHAAVAAGVLGTEESHRALLQSIVSVARAIFKAKASSILLLDEETDELVFEAAADEASESLIGRRFPSSAGIAGFVLVSRQPLVIEDVLTGPRFSRETAESTGFVPKGLMAVPLLHEERALGVLEVLDRPQDSRFTLAEMELLGLFANQAAIALDLLQRARRAESSLAGQGDLAVVARVAAKLEQRREEEELSPDIALRLLTELETRL